MKLPIARKLRKSLPIVTALMLGIGTILSGFGAKPPAASADAASPASALVEGFEQTANLQASTSNATASLSLVGRPETIHQGHYAAKLTYSFTGTTGTAAAYLNIKDVDNTVGKPIPGSPKEMGVWVYGDGNNHWLRAVVQDGTGKNSTIDLTSSTGLSWTGWKYIVFAIPTTLPTPLKIRQIYVVETKDTNKNGGALYFDKLTAFYTSTTLYGLELAGIGPMQVGEARQSQVKATYKDSLAPQAVPAAGVQFGSSDEQVATVDADGVVHALQEGVATITAATTGSAVTAQYELTVSASAPQPQSLELSAPTKLETGSSAALGVFANYADPVNPVSILSGVTFSSDPADIVAVDAAGMMRALRAGSTVVTAVYGGVSATLPVTVTDPVPVLQSIALLNLHTMTIGDSAQSVVQATYTVLPAPVTLTEGVTFTSSDSGVATVDADGLVTAKAFGAARIMATYMGKSASFYLVVNKPESAALPKRELRAAWIATVDNVDWPQKGVYDAEQQKADFIAQLDELQADGINAVIVQVKPTADAFYPSAYGPWSQWLTGEQGKDPGYNPLAFMLDEVHKRNMEFHAWFNPYRVSLDTDLSKLADSNPAIAHPDWRISYGNKLYLNPAIPEARSYIEDSIMEVVQNYDIDAVHFDDYFYPYPVEGVDFPDSAQYEAYRNTGGALAKDDWRRQNVDTFVQEIGAKIKAEKPYVKFGISPFGIWKNKSAQAPDGSDTNGLSSYSAIYADTKKWIDQGWVDYITPQIYWYMGYSPAAYDKLIAWWSNVVQGKNVHLYSGNAIYRIGEGNEGWTNPEEMPDQVRYNRNFEAVRGSMFFSATQFAQNPLGFTERLRTDLYRYPALVPTMPWLDAEAPDAPTLNEAVPAKNGVRLSWAGGGSADETAYVVYRFEGETAGSLDDAANILDTVRKQAGETQTYTDRQAQLGHTYTYVVTAVDRLQNESEAGSAKTLSVEADIAAPTTEAAVDGSPASEDGWYRADVHVVLSASDEGSGVAETVYSLDDGATWQAYTAPIPVTDEGETAIQYRSEDQVGNVEEAKTIRIRLDKTPPTLRIEGADKTYTTAETVTITCTAEDSVSGLVYNGCAEPLVQAPAAELGIGTHEVVAEAQDRAGHTVFARAAYEIVAAGGGGTPGPGGSAAPSQPDTTRVGAEVNGSKFYIASVRSSVEDGRKVSTMTFLTDEVNKAIDSLRGAVISVPVDGTADTFVGELPGQALSLLADGRAVLDFRSDRAAYKLPAAALQLDELLAGLGDGAKAEDIVARIVIASADEAAAKDAAQRAAGLNADLLAAPVEFHVVWLYKGKELQAKPFGGFVERSLPLSGDIGANRVAAGVRIGADGSLYPVPTIVRKGEDGRYWATLSSYTNSAYAVIARAAKTFADVQGHWSQKAVDSLASRLIIEGQSADAFAPNLAITRAEFAAIVLRSLGLATDATGAAYADVPAAAWYAGIVSAANEYGLVTGYADGTFRPDRQITRAEAAVVLSRAAKLAGLIQGGEAAGMGGGGSGSGAWVAADAASIPSWAASAFEAATSLGLLSGYEDRTLRPQAPVTRAESAQMLHNLLLQAKLLDS